MENYIEIISKSKKYKVTFINEIDELVYEFNNFKEAVIIVDNYILKKYSYLFKKINPDFSIISLEATEQAKTLSQVELLLKSLQENNVTKSTTILAIGGGIIQDITIFISHIYYRGLDIHFFPTTLLSMCDSCIGSKCGLNFNGFKNQLGVFHPPNKVIIWLGFLQSLSTEALYSGYGEILKLMLISGKKNILELKFNFSESLEDLYNYIYQSLIIKKKFIEKDEYDRGIRRLLNYGHTFGHALELASNYVIPHGIAVARGMDIVNYTSLKLGFMSDQVYESIHNVIKNIFFSNYSLDFCFDDLIKNVNRDKKIYKGILNLVLLKSPGNLFLHPVESNKLNNIVFDYLQLI
ncbi:3-dehydroquinate synthase family protein [Rickettsiella endosymbiont of Rhagonycha lignosa]|uniref:3-dehydroquinate synthase family protein n=1 Tax=Rickettsiella endosymbiont of Rhagonycha lignosa TaxID=3077937 RepID=UPI00313A9ADF